MEKRQITRAIMEKKTKNMCYHGHKADNMCYHDKNNFLVPFFFKIVGRFCVAHINHRLFPI